MANAEHIPRTVTYKTLEQQQNRVASMRNERDLVKLYYRTKEGMKQGDQVMPPGMTSPDMARLDRYYSEIQTDLAKVDGGDWSRVLEFDDDAPGLTGGAAEAQGGGGRAAEGETDTITSVF